MRYRHYLRQRYRLILGYSGSILAIIGLLLLTPLLALIFFPGEHALIPAFLLPGLGLILIGWLLHWRLTPDHPTSLTIAEGTVIVLIAWLMAIIAGGLPFIPASGLNFTQAIFEATSGWTTTGLSVIDVETASPLILLYRSILQLAGGAGFAIIMLTALMGPVGAGLTTAEGRGEQLEPHVRQSASIVLRLYGGYAAAGVVGLRLAGMTWFDAVNHAFAALSTGGFSTHADSFAYWDSFAIEVVTIVLMLLGTVNFLISYAVMRGRWQALLRSSEVRLLALLLALGTLVIFFGASFDLYAGPAKALRVALFETVSAVSTTGFASVSYLPWPSLGWLALIGLMLIGGGSGSTAGGLKQIRLLVLAKSLWWDIRRPLYPRTVVREISFWQGEQRRFLDDSEVRAIVLFVCLHLMIFGLGSVALTAFGYGMAESMFEWASCISTIGLSVGVTHAGAPSGVLWTETLGMFLGRLEFLAVFTGLAKLSIDAATLLGRRNSA